MDFYHKKKRDFHGITGKISIKNQKLLPNGTVKGILQIQSKAVKSHHGIRVQLEAIFSTASSEKRLNHSCDELTSDDTIHLLPGTEDVTLGKSCISFSPTGSQVLGEPFNEGISKQMFSLLPGTTSYMFSFVMTSEHLPASYKKWYNSEALEYRVVAYMRESEKFVRIASKVVPYGGHYVLSPDVQTAGSLPAYSNCSKEGSGSFEVQGMKIFLSTDKPDYLPDESIGVKMMLTYDMKINLLVTLSCSLVKQMTLKLNGYEKQDETVLNGFETKVKSDMMSRHSTGHTVIFGKLPVPHGCPPSYESPSYSVVYFYRYEIAIAGPSKALHYPPIGPGEVIIVIGTTREVVGRNEFIDDQNAVLLSSSTRYGCEEGVSSDWPIAGSSRGTMPPPYSQLSPRAESHLSLETLPPSYEDVS